jgi:hypothetical protein
MMATFHKRLGDGVRIELRIEIKREPSSQELLELAALLETFAAGIALRCLLCACEQFCDCCTPCKLCATRARRLPSTEGADVPR